MYISGIKVANNKGNITNGQTVRYSSMPTNKLDKGTDKISFGAIDPITAYLAQELAERAAGGVLGHFKIKALIKKAEDFLYNNQIEDGIEIAIALHSKLSGKFFSSLFFDSNKILEIAADKACKLSDEYTETRDLKKRLLTTMFLGEESCHDRNALTLLKNLNNNHYGEFKKYLLSRFVLKKGVDYHTEHIESLLECTNDRNFIQKLKSTHEEIRSQMPKEDFYSDSDTVDIIERCNRV